MIVNKKFKWIIITLALLTIASVITVAIRHRQRENIVMEIIIFPGGGGSAYRFIIRNDRTLISHFGNTWEQRGMITRGNIIRFVRQRSRTTLSEEDFHTIVEMADFVTENYCCGDGHVFSTWNPYLIYNDLTFGNFNVSGTLHNLSLKVYSLSPLSNR